MKHMQKKNRKHEFNQIEQKLYCCIKCLIGITEFKAQFSLASFLDYADINILHLRIVNRKMSSCSYVVKL